MEATAISAPHEGRRHLQRLIRKVKHVLIVKHCIDDLKGGVGLRQCRGVLLQRTYVHFRLFPRSLGSESSGNLYPQLQPVFTQFGSNNVHEDLSKGCSAKKLK